MLKRGNEICSWKVPISMVAGRRRSIPTCRLGLDLKAKSTAMAGGGLKGPPWLSQMTIPDNSAFFFCCHFGIEPSPLTPLCNSCYMSLGRLAWAFISLVNSVSCMQSSCGFRRSCMHTRERAHAETPLVCCLTCRKLLEAVVWEAVQPVAATVVVRNGCTFSPRAIYTHIHS